MNKKIKDNLEKHKWLAPALAVLVCFAVSLPIFEAYYWRPNSMMYAFGGDALVIYYDVIYHTCYDQGTQLSNMNYPHGEYVFLTDAQGAVSSLLQWIHRYLFDVCDHIMGIMHSLNLLALLTGSLMVHFILRRLGTGWLISIIFPSLIILLCPQILRFTSHYGLAYPFMIPMAILWYLRKVRVQSFEWRDLLVGLVMTFFTFNNPYVGFITALPLFILAGLEVLLDWRKGFQKALKYAVVPLVSLAIVFITFKLQDDISDRIKLQWGFFHFTTDFEGMFLPNRGLFREGLLALGFDLPNVRFERRQYLGIVPGIIFILLTHTMLIPPLRRRWKSYLSFIPEHGRLMIMATILFAITSKYLWGAVDEYWMENNLGFILMFKAMSRLAWPVYFVITITSAVFLDKVYRNSSKSVLSTAMIALCILVYLKDIDGYVNKKINNNFHPNFYSAKELQTVRNQLNKANIDISDYQAMLVVPKLMAWTDLFLSNIHFNSQFNSMRISSATGIPLVSSMLSRMSISQTAEGVQMISDPIIRKELAYKFPNEKPILVLLGKNHPALKRGEQWIIDNSTLLMERDNYFLYSISVDKLRNSYQNQEIMDWYTSGRPKNVDFRRKDFEDDKSEVTFVGKGAYAMEKGTRLLWETDVPASSDSLYTFAGWTEINYIRHGTTIFYVEVVDPEGKRVFNQAIHTREGNDVQDMWIRNEVEFKAYEGCKMFVTVEAPHLLHIDEFWLYPTNQRANLALETGTTLSNGYKVMLK